MSQKLPLKTLKALAQAQYCYIVVLQAALRDIHSLPKEPYEQALALAFEQFKTLLDLHAKRTNETKTQKMIDSITKAVSPVEDKDPANG
jgi:ABC-type antimicrobial peptide transport system ATPase subunit